MASKKYDYVLTDIAAADVDEIFEYIADVLLNPAAASSFADTLEGKLEELCKEPKIGRLVENKYLRRGDIRRILIDNFVAYYIIDDEKMEIVVLRIVYNRRSQDGVLKQL